MRFSEVDLFDPTFYCLSGDLSVVESQSGKVPNIVLLKHPALDGTQTQARTLQVHLPSHIFVYLNKLNVFLMLPGLHFFCSSYTWSYIGSLYVWRTILLDSITQSMYYWASRVRCCNAIHRLNEMDTWPKELHAVKIGVKQFATGNVVQMQASSLEAWLCQIETPAIS